MAEQLKIKNEGALRVIEFYNPPQNYITHVMLRELYTQLPRICSPGTRIDFTDAATN